MTTVTVLQVVGIVLVIVENNVVADNYFNGIKYSQKTAGTIYGSYLVCISICMMLVSYLIGFIIQYRSLMRLIQFLTPNRYIQIIIFVFSLFLMLLYFCALIQALIYFWGVAAIQLTSVVNDYNKDRACFGWFVNAFMDDKFDPSTFNYSVRNKYYQTLTPRVMWIIKLGDQLVFVMSAVFQIFMIILNSKINRIQKLKNFAINDEGQQDLLSQEQV